MQGVQIEGMDQLEAALTELLKEIPEARREMHERIATVLKGEVDKQIDASGLMDRSGKVKRWQVSSVGSGGGYAAVRAEKGSTGANSPGAITNYLESGHKIRSASGKAKRLRKSRAKKPYVSGYHFYQAARRNAQNIAIAEAQKYAEEIARKLEGK